MNSDDKPRDEEKNYDEAYQRALKYGEEKSNRIPVMIIGQDRAGKTSLRKRLLGERFDSEEPSTVGIHVDFIEVTDNTSSEPWKPRSQQRFFVSKHAANDNLLKKMATMVRERQENLEKVPEYKDLKEQRKNLKDTEGDYSFPGETFIQNEDIMTNDALLPTQPASGYMPISNTSFPVPTLDQSVQPIDEPLSPSPPLYQHSEIMSISSDPIQSSKHHHQMIDMTPFAGSTCNEQYSGTNDAETQDQERISSPLIGVADWCSGQNKLQPKKSCKVCCPPQRSSRRLPD